MNKNNMFAYLVPKSSVIFEEERAVAVYSFLHQKEDPKKVFNRISF